eukprot:Tbor_TRINITY_DN5294_c2_g7::TRINITY_DN5294_c2_g7_i1::g.16015::m.16015
MFHIQQCSEKSAPIPTTASAHGTCAASNHIATNNPQPPTAAHSSPKMNDEEIQHNIRRIQEKLEECSADLGWTYTNIAKAANGYAYEVALKTSSFSVLMDEVSKFTEKEVDAVLATSQELFEDINIIHVHMEERRRGMYSKIRDANGLLCELEWLMMQMEMRNNDKREALLGTWQGSQ